MKISYGSITEYNPVITFSQEMNPRAHYQWQYIYIYILYYFMVTAIGDSPVTVTIVIYYISLC